VRRTGTRAVRRTANRAVRRTANRAVRRTANRAVRRTATRAVRRTANRAVRRTANRTLRRTVGRTGRTFRRTANRTFRRTARRTVGRRAVGRTGRTFRRTTRRRTRSPSPSSAQTKVGFFSDFACTNQISPENAISFVNNLCSSVSAFALTVGTTASPAGIKPGFGFVQDPDINGNLSLVFYTPDTISPCNSADNLGFLFQSGLGLPGPCLTLGPLVITFDGVPVGSFFFARGP